MSTASSPPTRTVGETKSILATLLGVPPDSIGHYAIAVESGDGTHLKFCCCDRRHAAAMLGQAAVLVLSEEGKSAVPGQAPPPMPP